MRCKGLVLRRHRYARLLRQGWSSAVPHMQHRGASDTTGTILKSKRTIQAVAIVCIHSVPNIPCVRLCAWPMPKSKLCGFTAKISRNVNVCCWVCTQSQCGGPFGCRFLSSSSDKQGKQRVILHRSSEQECWFIVSQESRPAPHMLTKPHRWCASLEKSRRSIREWSSDGGLRWSHTFSTPFAEQLPCEISWKLASAVGALYAAVFFHFSFLFVPFLLGLFSELLHFHTRRAACLIFFFRKKEKTPCPIWAFFA